MSFGTSSSDVDTVVAFCRALYRKCRDAGGEYDEISHEVRGMRLDISISLISFQQVSGSRIQYNNSYEPIFQVMGFIQLKFGGMLNNRD